jgi:hypothetical protein
MRETPYVDVIHDVDHENRRQQPGIQLSQQFLLCFDSFFSPKGREPICLIPAFIEAIYNLFISLLYLLDRDFFLIIIDVAHGYDYNRQRSGGRQRSDVLALLLE